ncbi:MAG: hypothetical protein H6Q48_35 [Deltaproteobacteria bacterium]|nr:hypothetical protein [Deltaproteobacteria bacterium]
MLPIGPLMIEHRLIEKMIKVMKGQLDHVQAGNHLDSSLIETITDFIRAYADRCHHGKEEDILFRELSKKVISSEHKRIIDQLLEDHKLGRKITKTLVEANQKYKQGDQKALPVITDCLHSLVTFYPKHIEKEDKHFFLPIMAYFTKKEKDSMLIEGYEFDSNLLHEEYKNIVEEAEIRVTPGS